MSKISESQKQDIKEMIAGKLGIDPEKILDDSKLQDDLGADSLDEVDFVMELEKMFDISVPDDDYEYGMDIQKLYEIVERYTL
jgi:acyl carrier protein